MASPFYIPMRDMFNEGIQARQAAQQQFASQLAQLYAGGDMRAGQALAGMAPEQATQIRTAMEAMPGTEFSKVKQRADLLKKWHYAIQNEQDETTRALMYNQMLAQVQAAGGDISGLAPQYSKEAMTRQMNELMTFDELAGMQKERRLADSGGGAGTEWERTVAELAGGDPQDPVWRQKYLKVFMTPKLVPNQVTGGVDEQYLPADPVISRKALSVGLGINAPSRAVLNAGPGEITVPDGQPGGAPSPATQASAPQPAVPTTVVRGEPPAMSRAERERLAAEERAAAKERAAKEESADKDIAAAKVFYDTTIGKFNELINLVSTMTPGESLYSEKLTKARSIIGRLLTDIKSQKMADLGAITPSDIALLSGFVPDLTGTSAQRFIPSQAVIPLQQGLQYVRDKANQFYAQRGKPSPYEAGKQPAQAGWKLIGVKK